MAIIFSFSLQGGVYVEENWDKVIRWHVDVLKGIDDLDIKSGLPESLGEKGPAIERFLRALWRFYSQTGFAYLEINPFTFHRGPLCPWIWWPSWTMLRSTGRKRDGPAWHFPSPLEGASQMRNFSSRT